MGDYQKINDGYDRFTQYQVDMKECLESGLCTTREFVALVQKAFDRMVMNIVDESEWDDLLSGVDRVEYAASDYADRVETEQKLSAIGDSIIDWSRGGK